MHSFWHFPCLVFFLTQQNFVQNWPLRSNEKGNYEIRLRSNWMRSKKLGVSTYPSQSVHRMWFTEVLIHVWFTGSALPKKIQKRKEVPSKTGARTPIESEQPTGNRECWQQRTQDISQRWLLEDAWLLKDAGLLVFFSTTNRTKQCYQQLFEPQQQYITRTCISCRRRRTRDWEARVCWGNRLSCCPSSGHLKNTLFPVKSCLCFLFWNHGHHSRRWWRR